MTRSTIDSTSHFRTVRVPSLDPSSTRMISVLGSGAFRTAKTVWVIVSRCLKHGITMETFIDQILIEQEPRRGRKRPRQKLENSLYVAAKRAKIRCAKVG